RESAAETQRGVGCRQRAMPAPQGEPSRTEGLASLLPHFQPRTSIWPSLVEPKLRHLRAGRRSRPVDARTSLPPEPPRSDLAPTELGRERLAPRAAREGHVG